MKDFLHNCSKKTRFLIIAFQENKAVFVFRRVRKIAKSDC